MDKGLDIDGLRRVLAYHSALYTGRSDAASGVSSYRRTILAAANPGATLPAVVTALQKSGMEPRWDLADEALCWAEAADHHLISIDDARYPALLREIAVPPPILFVAGAAEFLAQTQIAVVGSRRATRHGREFATELARDLAATGLVVTSGLAYGIDVSAHRGALDAGSTIAVFGCGIDRIYPSRHRDLCAEIIRSGAIVSEFPLGAPPRPYHFPQRNRIISGLARGTVVVEAALKSGSISTAMHAADQGREVFAVPGSVRNPLARGSHALIAQGAKLIECAGDILNEFDDLSMAGVHAPVSTGATIRVRSVENSLGPVEAELFEACGWEPFTIDGIVSQSGLTAQEVSSMLLMLELAGRIATHSAGTYVRVR